MPFFLFHSTYMYGVSLSHSRVTLRLLLQSNPRTISGLAGTKPGSSFCTHALTMQLIHESLSLLRFGAASALLCSTPNDSCVAEDAKSNTVGTRSYHRFAFVPHRIIRRFSSAGQE